ncbi:translation initiation factor IF-2 subunit gamma [Candidatus Geothermarchaeota archaeon ex4572_27]|nr:MAG: translation initiation factor IF-2 subunit gamma [Candidatus Geothermarchaeota archaeon ex4572_27]
MEEFGRQKQKLKIPRQPEINVGCVGHVDHGKTTMIQALTGIWTSSHSEELRRGVTIKIGYADMPIYELRRGSDVIYWPEPEYPGYSDPKLMRVISFVDCPGHESLMANMLSGAAVMDAAILVIAANEPCPRPQTKEHAMALEILGIKNIIVVQNKLDLVTKEEAIKNYEQIKEFLAATKYYADAPIIPISAIQRVNLEYLVEAIQKYLPTPKRDLSKPARMVVIRSFNINLPGTHYKDLKGGVIGGSIIQGKIRVGDELEIVPGHLYKKGDKIAHEPLYTQVLSLSTQDLRLEEAHSGGLIGVQTDLDPALTKADGMVGNVAGKPGTLPEVRYTMTLDISLFEYVVGTEEQIRVKPLYRGEPLRLNVGSAVTLGVVTGLGKDWADVVLSRPVAADDGWKVAIARRFDSKWRLIGVGEVK